MSGMAILVIGAILPSLILEANLSYTVAGGLLSVMAIGNLLSSFFFPIMVASIGKRLSITLMAAMVPISLLVLTFLPSMPVMYLLMLLIGIARGCITIINNATVNEISNHSNQMLNLLHCSFAIGAFLAPFLAAILAYFGFSWKSILYLIILLCTTSTYGYATMDYPKAEKSASEASNKNTRSFLKSFDFYCIGFVLFFYLGVENCINGWFVTYLQSTGIMSQNFATTMVSFTWLVIMAGRLACASLSKRYSTSTILLMNAIGSIVCFFILISASGLTVITISLLGFGFFLAGIYPTCVANIGPLIQGSTLGMSILTAISAVGGIITPQLVGSAADQIGLVAAISILSVNVILVFILTAINFKRRRQS
ncbi:MAG: MFS transporter [Hungatella sp.]